MLNENQRKIIESIVLSLYSCISAKNKKQIFENTGNDSVTDFVNEIEAVLNEVV